MSEAHAPGKLVLCGEYAVLHGAPAIAVAVAVRARATVTAAPGPCRLLVAHAGGWSFDWAAEGALHWRESPPAGQGRLLEAVAAAMAGHGRALVRAVEISLDSRAFQARRANGGVDKLGLGSSAAVTVALVAALLAEPGRPATDRLALAAICLDAHRHLQGGRGSGIDVAAALHGGVVTITAMAGGPAVRPLAWPAGLHALAVWSGRGASTPEMLARFDEFRRADPARFERHLRELHRIGVDAVNAWERAEVGVVLRSLTDYDDALRALDDGARIGIYTPVHAGLARTAQAAGATYKISGAGGGDFGVAFADSRAIIEALQARWAGEDMLTVPVSAGVPGFAVTPP